ncbi:asparagine synthetase B family protein, partial [Kitasatospora indigofera]|uniref:asparagine synthetase B family protein n=1 Tax=Kitasatospora indigofera TaxID=67307 RepID=UPI00367E56E9
MARCCACAGPDEDRARAQLAALTGAPARPGAAPAALIDGEPGHASGPFTLDGLTAVGEVTLHNRSDLLAALAAAGAAAPAGCPDGELLLRCWARLGAAGIRAAEGMFVLIVVDGTDLVLIRDQVGARTVFYARADGCWAASTSLRSLRHWPALGTGLNVAAVRSFLTFAYLPGEETLLRGVLEALPGRILRLAADGSATQEPYWEPSDALAPRGGLPAGELTAGGPTSGGPGPGELGPEAYAARLRTLLEDATRCRLPQDESVAVLLSGGVDSSLVTALAAKLHIRPVHTYSISFGDELPNELGYSGLVAEHCGTRHRILTVSGEQVAARLADTVALLDSPVGDPLTVPNLMLAEAVAGDGLRVSLNGEGGDPVFGGPKNLPMLVHELHRDDPSPGARAEAYLRSYRKCYQDLPVLLTPEGGRGAGGRPAPARRAPPEPRARGGDGRREHREG